MDRGEVRIPINGAISGKPTRETEVNAWTERIIVCRKCGWEGAEAPKCPRCGIPLTNYSSTIIPI